MKGKYANGIKSKTELISPNERGISILHCDILDNEELETLSQNVQETFKGVDIIIDNATNGIFTQSNKDDCRTFVDGTSEKLRTTINVRENFPSVKLYSSVFRIKFNLITIFFFFLSTFQMLMHFIPKMKYSKCGHFVTVQPVTSNQKPLLSSYREIKELINLLTDNQQSTFALDLFNKQKIRLTTVVWNSNDTSIPSVTCNGLNNNFNQADIKEISERILDGIRADRSVVHVNKSLNLIRSIGNYFQKKKTPNANCNGHNEIR